MGAAKRLVGGAIFLIFVSALLLRPLLSNPAITATISDGLSDWRILLWLSLLLVTVLLLVLRFKSTASPEEFQTTTNSPDPSMHGLQEPLAEDSEPGEESRKENEGNSAPNILGGQGGARDRDFEIEQEPPDALLSDHLEHLRAGLDGREHAVELETLEDVVDEYEEEETIPERCPQEHCRAAWAERGIIGLKTGRYDLLDEGHKIQCQECEEVYLVE